MEFLKESHLENMVCGPFNNKSYFGYKSSILKSGICKYFRREQFGKLEWCIIEMFLFGLKNNGMMTNVINRLKILIMEEIVFSEIGSIIGCIKLFDTLDEENDIMKKLCLSISIIRIACTCKKGRVCSYVNNWWKYNSIQKSETIKLKYVNRFKKIEDTQELLEYGELLINYVKNKDEKLFEIYTILFNMKGKMGRRYRRSDPIYLYWNVIEEYYCYNYTPGSKLKILNPNKKKLFNFALNMFNRKNMKERRAFGIWIGLFVVWGSDTIIIPTPPDVTISDLLKDRTKISIDEDYVVKDFHVNKKFGLSAFGTTGAYVVNEDTSCIGYEIHTGVSKLMKYREYYQIQKHLQEQNIQNSNVPEFISGTSIDNNNTFHFKIIKVLEEGVCGLKKCCILVKNLETQTLFVIKEMPKSMNYGVDYLFMDELKPSLGLQHLGMFRITSRTYLDVIDKTIKSYVGNWKFNHTNNEETYYCVMNYKENIDDIGKHKELLTNISIKEEMLKIRLFNGLFGTSDNILRNILVDKDKKTLYSIDENDIYGKRKNIFNKNDWCLKDKWCMSNMERVWNELLKTINNDIIIDKFKQFGLDNKIEEFKTRLSYKLEDITRT